MYILQGDLGFIFYPPKKTRPPPPPIFQKNSLLLPNNPSLFSNNPSLFSNNPSLFSNNPSLFSNNPSLSRNNPALLLLKAGALGNLFLYTKGTVSLLFSYCGMLLIRSASQLSLRTSLFYEDDQTSTDHSHNLHLQS